MAYRTLRVTALTRSRFRIIMHISFQQRVETHGKSYRALQSGRRKEKVYTAWWHKTEASRIHRAAVATSRLQPINDYCMINGTNRTKNGVPRWNECMTFTAPGFSGLDHYFLYFIVSSFGDNASISFHDALCKISLLSKSLF